MLMWVTLDPLEKTLKLLSIFQGVSINTYTSKRSRE
jgi:hypothetical protein